MVQALFGFDGRLARLPFFGYGLLVAVVTWAMPMDMDSGLIGPFARRSMNSLSAGSSRVFFEVLVAAGFIIWMWTALALVVKRLHDMGMSGAHVIWMVVISNVAAYIGGFGILLSLVAIGLQLWLLLAPGQPEDNEYGSVPGTGAEV